MADPQESFQILYDAFNDCDHDKDGRLKVHEFLEFCASGLGKPQSDEGMYTALCGQMGIDPSLGVSWNDISHMFQQSNAEPIVVETSPQPPREHIRQASTSYENLGRDSRGLTADALSRHDRYPSTASIGDYEDELGSQASERGHHVRTTSLKRDSSMAELAIIEALQGSNDAQQKKLKQMSKEIKHLKKKSSSLNRDKDSVVEQNQRLNAQISNMQSTLQRLETEKAEVKGRLSADRQNYEQKIRLLQNQVDDDRKTIAHLEGQYQHAQQERDQVLQLFKNAETQFENQLVTIKRKHKEQLEKVSVGFLQSLGAQPGEDIRQVVRDLRNEKAQLTQQVGMLAEQLTRKDRSLYEALQAIDILSTQQKRLMRGTGRRASQTLGAGETGLAGGTAVDDDAIWRFDKENPDYFIEATGGSGGISASQNNARRPIGPEGQAKEYQMVANAMTAQVVEREKEIENLREANTVLGMQLNRNGK